MSLDVVVPARNEGALVGACVRSVLADGLTGVRVIVVANGCADDTAERAAAAGATVVETPGDGKAAALNRGLGECRDGSVVFLDADTVLTPGTTRALATALDVPTPRLAAPRPLLIRPRGPLARGYAQVWTRLPGIADDVIGAGCYALNAPARARCPEFPPIVADDAYVRTRFTRDERHVLTDGTFLLVLPEGRELIRVVRRWRTGNAALDDSPAATRTSNMRFAIHPEIWPHLPAFLTVLVATRLAGRLGPPDAWARADGVREVGRQATEYTFLIDPGVTPAPDARAQLATLASRFPDGGIFGAGPAARYARPRAIALVETHLWERTGRPTTVTDLCGRARRFGARPMTTPLARYTRSSGGPPL
ncbi:glycosyltransferase [Actinokineospora enzanensis]|uniref:glycosyltransferase n=1 Tax=Actinokineospora enzanensis TaxID=155975 RepID=UPI00035DA7DE|nr:glycosyltransferase family 2 protein [Actinokineospora enzanensis]